MNDESQKSEGGEVDSERIRGRGRGGSFFVLDRDVWERVWQVETANRMNLVATFLVLLAGTGADHRLTKWSAKACEERVGIGKPRAKLAIEELIRGGLAQHTAASKPAFPQYRLAEQTSAKEPIFLPVQLVTGLSEETPVLRRVRESGDPLVLRMLIDLYGLLQTDATYSAPLGSLRMCSESDEHDRKISEMGANAIWSLGYGTTIYAAGDWAAQHYVKGPNKQASWHLFWERLNTLQKIGALMFEPWLFDSAALDSEPLFPVYIKDLNRSEVSENVKILNSLITQAVEALVGERNYLIDQNSDRYLVVMPTHHGRPAIRNVARLRVEPDTPGRRASFGRRNELVDRSIQQYRQLVLDIDSQNFSRPIRIG